MAIDDHPAWANHNHGRQIEQRIATLEADLATLLTDKNNYRRRLEHHTKEWQEQQEVYARNLAIYNNNLKEIFNRVKEHLSWSAFPELYIHEEIAAGTWDIEEYGYPKPTEAADAVKALDALTYAETAELVRDQDALQRIATQREALINGHKWNSKKWPDVIEKLKTALDNNDKHIRELTEQLDEQLALRKENDRAVQVHVKGVSGKAEVGVTATATASVEKADPQMMEMLRYRNDNDRKLRNSARRLKAAEARENELKAALAAAELRIAVLVDETEKTASKSAQEVVEESEKQEAIIKADLIPIDLKRHPKDSNAMLRHKEWLNEVQPVGKTYEVVLEEEYVGNVKDDHVRRSIALRAGVVLKTQRTYIDVIEHKGMNLFKVVFHDGGKMAIVGLGRGYKNKNKTILTHCRHVDFDKGWTDEFEVSGVNGVPKDVLMNVGKKGYKLEKLKEWHVQLSMAHQQNRNKGAG